MTTYVALLHSIVLGAGMRVVMTDLRRIAGEMGFSNPRTLVATGNLVVDSEQDLPVSCVEERLEQGIYNALGKHIDVIVLTAPDWMRLSIGNPFPADTKADGSRVMVRAMRSPLAEAVLSDLEPYCTQGERLAVVSGHLWVSFSGRASETRLLPQLTTRRLGVGTLRNWNTVNGLASMVSDAPPLLYSGPQTH